MRRSIRIGVISAVFGFGTVVCAAVPSQAGQGVSQVCDDNSGSGTEIPLVSNPITLHAEVGVSPAYVQVCYSTSPFGSTAPAITGGLIAIYDIASSPYLYCGWDNSPTVVSVYCNRYDPDPATPGYKVTAVLRLQSTTVVVDAGVEVGKLGSPACLRGLTAWGPTGQQHGPFDIGVC